MDVDPVQASAVEIHHLLSLADLPTSHPKSRNGGKPILRISPQRLRVAAGDIPSGVRMGRDDG